MQECTGAESELGYVEGEYTPVASASLADPYDTELLSGVDTEYVDGDVLLECSAFIGELFFFSFFLSSSFFLGVLWCFSPVCVCVCLLFAGLLGMALISVLAFRSVACTR